MRIFNEYKIKELSGNEIDLSLGKLTPDKIVKEHHEAVGAKTIEQQVKDLKTKGVMLEQSNGRWYIILKQYENGGKEVQEVKDIEAKDAYDEYEDIQVYIPYTPTELQKIKLDSLREQRDVECFPVINRGQFWYDTLTNKQKLELSVWYQDWLNVTDTMIVPTKPNWLDNTSIKPQKETSQSSAQTT